MTARSTRPSHRKLHAAHRCCICHRSPVWNQFPYGNVALRRSATTSHRPGKRWSDQVLLEAQMDITTLLIILLVIVLLGGGWYGRGRWY
ncbi:hypothetical protein EPK84_32435 [Sinorhizobium fredii]|nr:hypothetical protein EPK84_32435 [Sinorhizobium fredii]